MYFILIYTINFIGLNKMMQSPEQISMPKSYAKTAFVFLDLSDYFLEIISFYPFAHCGSRRTTMGPVMAASDEGARWGPAVGRG